MALTYFALKRPKECNKMIDALKELISIPSYAGQEKPVLEHIKKCLEGAGIQPFFQADNLLVRLKGKDPTRAFIFNGHVDVVDVGEVTDWKYDPWRGTVEDGRIYGRGTSDMKGGVLAMMETAKALAKNGLPPTDVWFTFVVREETDGSGTQQFVEWFQSEGYTRQYNKLAALCAEPTGLDTVQYGHRGNFFITAEIAGASGHSSRPCDITPHAILEMSRFISDLEKENKRWQKRFRNSDFAPPTITPTSIEAKSQSPNKTASLCRASLDLRTIPGYHKEAFNRVKQLADRKGIRLSLRFPPSPIGYTTPEAQVVAAVSSVLPTAKTGVLDASTDLGYLTQVGIEGVIFGPGQLSLAHRTNEYADIEQLVTAPGIFEKIYLTWAQTS